MIFPGFLAQCGDEAGGHIARGARADWCRALLHGRVPRVGRGNLPRKKTQLRNFVNNDDVLLVGLLLKRLLKVIVNLNIKKKLS